MNSIADPERSTNPNFIGPIRSPKFLIRGKKSLPYTGNDLNSVAEPEAIFLGRFYKVAPAASFRQAKIKALFLYEA